MHEPFRLKMNEKALVTVQKKDNVGPTIRHLVHHRGQLTVYMHLNNIPVPSIYNPSGDERSL